MCQSSCVPSITDCLKCENVYYNCNKRIRNPCTLLNVSPDGSKAKYIKEYGLGYDCFKCPCSCPCETTEPQPEPCETTCCPCAQN